jgi:peptidoglycan/LPS O-acetylase OafA/YrhL
MINGIQVLRGVAALLVAAFHLYAAAENEGNSGTLFSLFKGGGIGVDIFFVISGFVIYYASSRKTDWTRPSFLSGRLVRIYPLYWASLIFVSVLGLGLAYAAGDASRIVSIPEFLYAASLLPSSTYVISITWTLTIEMAFYVIFALTFFKGQEQSRLFMVLFIWALASIIYTLVFPDAKALSHLFHPAVPELLMGVLIAHTYSRGPMVSAWAFVAVGAVGVGFNLIFAPMEAYPILRAVIAGVPSACLVYGIVHCDIKKNIVAHTVGDASYALYLFHIPFYLVLGFILERLTGQNVYFSDGLMLAMLIAALIGAYVIHKIFDSPIQKYFRHKLK